MGQGEGRENQKKNEMKAVEKALVSAKIMQGRL